MEKSHDNDYFILLSTLQNETVPATTTHCTALNEAYSCCSMLYEYGCVWESCEYFVLQKFINFL